MLTRVFDLETNGLLPELTTIHCLSVKEDNNDPILIHKSNEIKDYIFDSLNKGLMVGHNILGFDLKAIQKVYPNFEYSIDQVVDTLVVSKTLYPNMPEIDSVQRIKRKLSIPSNLTGRHSLEAWGYRLNSNKGDFKGPWDKYCEEMGIYCLNDVVLTDKLLTHLLTKKLPKDASRLEHRIKQECLDLEQNGFNFDQEKAVKLYSGLVNLKTEIEERLSKEMPYIRKYVDLPDSPYSPKVNNKKQGYVKGALLNRIKYVDFNPSSRDHIAELLIKNHGWKPEVFTPSGKPKIDEDTLEDVDIPEAKLIVEHFILDKRIGQLATGDKAWLKHVGSDGKMHGAIDPMGTVTSRAAHHNPNMGQIPQKGKPYGEECRELFIADDNRVLVGSDLSGLELRCLAHYTARWDKGKYGKEILEGDIHTVNQKAAGLETRAQAKTFIYALLYGAGPAKIGAIINGSYREGKNLQERFFTRLPALGALITHVKRQAQSNYVVGLDGRKIPVRSQHSALNTLLQSAGAIIAKRWVVTLMDKIREQGLDANIIGWVHDEVILDVSKEHSKTVQDLCVESAKLTGKYYNLNIDIEAESKEGLTWLDIH